MQIIFKFILVQMMTKCACSNLGANASARDVLTWVSHTTGNYDEEVDESLLDKTNPNNQLCRGRI